MTVMRLQRALARAGVASRRAAEQLIEAGVVRVDGQVATLGSSVDPDRQVITVRGRKVTQKPRRWIALGMRSRHGWRAIICAARQAASC